MPDFRPSQHHEEERRVIERLPPPTRPDMHGLTENERLLAEINYSIAYKLWESRTENQRVFGLMHRAGEERIMEAMEQYVKSLVPDGDIEGHHDYHKTLVVKNKLWTDRWQKGSQHVINAALLVAATLVVNALLSYFHIQIGVGK